MAAEFEAHRLRTGLDIERLAKEFGKEVRDEIKAVREEVKEEAKRARDEAKKARDEAKKARDDDKAEARRRNRWIVGLAVGVAGGIATLLLRAFGG